MLWADFVQTVVKGALSGFVIGVGSAFVAALLIDRSPFLQRGLLPVGNFVAALPIVGLAPILVMWFGFDWHSKAAVVVVMVSNRLLTNRYTADTRGRAEVRLALGERGVAAVLRRKGVVGRCAAALALQIKETLDVRS